MNTKSKEENKRPPLKKLPKEEFISFDNNGSHRTETRNVRFAKKEDPSTNERFEKLVICVSAQPEYQKRRRVLP